MQVFISTNQPQLAKRLQSSLNKLDMPCPDAQVISHQVAGEAVEGFTGDSQTVLFFCSESLSTEDLSALDQLCDRNSPNVRVVVVGQSFSAGAILSAIRSGAIDCIQMTSCFDSELRSLLDRMQRAVGGRKRQGRLLTVIRASGGAGASLISLNLAALQAQRASSCALLDLHWRGGDLATLMNVSPKHTLLSLSGKLDQLDRAMFEQTIVKHETGICLLASPEPFSDCRQLRAELIQKVVHIARSEYGSVIADLENCDHEDQVRTLAASDKIVIPLRPDVVSLVRTQKFIKYLVAAGVNAGNLSVVINRVGQRKELPEDLINDTLQLPNLFTLPDDPIAANESINVGVPIVIGRPKSKIAECLRRLSDSLSDQPRGAVQLSATGYAKLSSELASQTMRSVARALTAVGAMSLKPEAIGEGRQYA